MGLKDLFKPKWQHTNESVREKAIMNLDDDKLLKEISLKDLT